MNRITRLLVFPLVAWAFIVGYELGDLTRQTNDAIHDTKRVEERFWERFGGLQQYYFDLNYGAMALVEDAANACVYGNRFNDVEKLCSRYIDEEPLADWSQDTVQLLGEGKSYKCGPYVPD